MPQCRTPSMLLILPTHALFTDSPSSSIEVLAAEEAMVEVDTSEAIDEVVDETIMESNAIMETIEEAIEEHRVETETVELMGEISGWG